ncbi:uncharacterized protein K02A2.6-like [Sabethes cyaneus]|uniref:uncharacterized protein K02A2.6-like n=1 Tax=Sabethes cyaneus TaxID=53552 RepID=UPI00237EC085|nr:uncharacterized protein K02A2.6-like [Sabethes cyaneus]
MDNIQFQQLLDHQTRMFAELCRGLTTAVNQSNTANASASRQPCAASVTVPQPSPLALEGDMQENFDFFEKSWRDYAKAIGMDRWPAADDPQKEVIQGLKGVECIADDLLLYGKGSTFEEALIDHNTNLENLLSRLEERNVKLNRSKLKLCQTSVDFYGHVLTDQGLKPDESKISTIRNFPTPSDRKEVHRFVGMINYLSRFIPNLSMNITNLRRLISTSVPWQWTEIEEEEFKRVKNIVSDIGTLRYYNMNLPITIECDASCFGLGAAVFQEDGVIGYASRTLTATEKNYAQIEKELLVILFACVRFDQLIVGNPRVTIKTDHRPLINIFRKPLLSAPRRLQHMLLNLQRYRISLEYVTGKNNVVADALSRAPLNDNATADVYKKSNIYKVIEQVGSVRLSNYLSISDTRLSEIIQATAKDSTMQLIIEFILNGWPTTADQVPDSVKIYFRYCQELSTQDGLVFRNDRILIPHSLRRKLIDICHASHSGIEATLKLARANLFWPGMSVQIKEVVQSCTTCAKFAASQSNPPMVTHSIPVYPFQFVSMDVFFADFVNIRRAFLVTVDHYSDYFEVDVLKDLKPDCVIAACKENFARHGKPQVILTDNGTNFVCQKMVEFAREWDFQHITSAPHHQQANGKAEAAVKIAKRLLKKSQESGIDFWYALLHWRNIPNKIGSSPAARLFSRSTSCGIPTSAKNLFPKVVEGVPGAIEANRKKIKFHYDKVTKTLPNLQVGSPVYVQLNPETSKQWTPGTILNRLSERSFQVEVDGAGYRRSAVHIKPRKELASLPTAGPGHNRNPVLMLPEDENFPDRNIEAVPNNAVIENGFHASNQSTFAAIDKSSSSSTVPIESSVTTPRASQPKEKRVSSAPRPVDRPRREIRLPNRFKDYHVNLS